MKYIRYANSGLQNIEFNDNSVDKSVGGVGPMTVAMLMKTVKEMAG